MDKFDTSVALLISSLVGAGVFAMPIFARQVGLLSVFVITASFLYMLGLGYLIIEMFPGTVEEEVDRYVGPWAGSAMLLVEISIIFLALTSYAMALKTHLGISDLSILIILLIPLILELHLPSNFTLFTSFFTLAFVSILSLLAIPRMELPVSIFLASGSIVTQTAKEVVAPSLINLSAVLPLFLVGLFAFYGHNMIPRIRNVVRNQKTTKKVFYMAISIVFLLYLPFVISVSGLGVDKLATKYLSEYFTVPLSSTIDLFSLVIFYTAFMIYGTHLATDFGGRKKSTGLIIGGVAILYFLASLLQVSSMMVIAAAGFGVTLYAFLVSLAGHNAKKLFPVPTLVLAGTVLTWLFLLFQVF